MKDQHDNETAYCRSLGHYVPFRYCRTVSSDLPCRRILDCWFEKLNIRQFVADNYTTEERDKMFAPPPEKISTIIDLIQKAKEQK